MHLNKKGSTIASGMGWETKTIITALISLVVCGSLLFILFGNVSEMTCKTSVYFADQSQGLSPNLCYTEDVVIDTDDEYEVKLQVAEHMRKCWSMWGEGDLNPKGKNWWHNEDYKCFKCYRLKFTNFEGEITKKDMYDFLEDPKNNVRGYDSNYVNYFDNAVVFGFKDKTYLEGNMIRKDEPYAITFAEDIEENNWFRYGGRITTGATTGAVTVSAMCIVIPGVNLATPACAVGGAAVGAAVFGSYTVAEDIYEGLQKWKGNLPDRDAMMFSKYEDVGLCGGYIS